jgi:hypothetical protein
MSAGPSLDLVPPLSPRPWPRYGPKGERAGHFRRYSLEQLTSVTSGAGRSDCLRKPGGSLFGTVNRVGVIPFHGM